MATFHHPCQRSRFQLSISRKSTDRTHAGRLNPFVPHGSTGEARDGNADRRSNETGNERHPLIPIMLPETSPEPVRIAEENSPPWTDELLFTRYAGNPILSRKDWPYPVNSVFNAAATKLADGDTLLLCRVEDQRGLSNLCAARSTNGIDGWRIDAHPTLVPDPKNYPEEI
jgi:hypothetical protein